MHCFNTFDFDLKYNKKFNIPRKNMNKTIDENESDTSNAELDTSNAESDTSSAESDTSNSESKASEKNGDDSICSEADTRSRPKNENASVTKVETNSYNIIISRVEYKKIKQIDSNQKSFGNSKPLAVKGDQMAILSAKVEEFEKEAAEPINE
jgi:hypothetical protein